MLSALEDQERGIGSFPGLPVRETGRNHRRSGSVD
jgi:hypothetical protein